MEQNTAQYTCLYNKQMGTSFQVLMIDGCRVRVNYLSAGIDKANNSVLHEIHKLLLSSYNAK